MFLFLYADFHILIMKIQRSSSANFANVHRDIFCYKDKRATRTLQLSVKLCTFYYNKLISPHHYAIMNFVTSIHISFGYILLISSLYCNVASNRKQYIKCLHVEIKSIAGGSIFSPCTSASRCIYQQSLESSKVSYCESRDTKHQREIDVCIFHYIMYNPGL